MDNNIKICCDKFYKSPRTHIHKHSHTHVHNHVGNQAAYTESDICRCHLEFGPGRRRFCPQSRGLSSMVFVVIMVPLLAIIIEFPATELLDEFLRRNKKPLSWMPLKVSRKARRKPAFIKQYVIGLQQLLE